MFLFISLLGAVIFCPKTEEKLNACKMAVMGTMAILCYQALMAFIYDKIGIAVNISSTSLSMLLANAALWGYTIRKRRLQKLFFRFSDIITIVILTVFVLLLSLHMFTARLRLSYINTDPANHFLFAMQIVKTASLKSTGAVYFSAFVDAMVIEVLAPFLTVSKYYKAFIVADIAMHVLEILMFFVLMLTISDRKVIRWLAPVFAMGYFFGYPAYSYMTGGFVYWSTGVMIFILIIYALLLLERYPQKVYVTGPLLFLAAYANSCCNRLFIPVNFFALVVAFAVIMLRLKRDTINKKMILTGVAGVCAAGLVTAVVFWKYWGGSLEAMLAYVQVSGAMYKSLYVDLIFFVPALIYVFIHVFRKKDYSRTISVITLCMLLCTAVMYILVYNFMMSYYYYYKIYYNLWLSGWLLAIMATDILAEKKQMDVFAAYGGFIALIATLTLTNYDVKMWEHSIPNDAGVPINLFSIYRYNMDRVLMDYEPYTIPVELMEVYRYALEETEDEVMPILTTDERCMYWFGGMKAMDARRYRADQRELMDMVYELDNDGIDTILAVKKDSYYEAYQSYFQLCEVVYENEWAAILRKPADRWAGIAGGAGNYSEEKTELFTYVRENCNGERVPLMAQKSACIDYMSYAENTGQRSTDCYCWNYNLKENLDNLNELGIRYMLVLKDDSYYTDMQQYLEKQEIVFENEAGMIVKCRGNAWSTKYE